MGQLFLILTILSESGAIILMKLSDGFQHKVQAGFAFTSYVLAFIFLTLALKTLPAGITNALWAGGSTLLVVIASIFIFKEQLGLMQILFLSLIVIGLIGLNFSGAVK